MAVTPLTNQPDKDSGWCGRMMCSLVDFHYNYYHCFTYKDRQLLQFLSGSLGYRLGSFLHQHGFGFIPKFENHDLFHVLPGYGVTVSDEVQMQCCLAGSGRRTLSTWVTIIIGVAFYPVKFSHMVLRIMAVLALYCLQPAGSENNKGTIMTDYKLTYFDVNGGRAEPVRIAFHIAGIPFEDKRISYQEFGEIFPTMRFHSVPVLEIDGAQVTQSNAQIRYVGKMAGLYPTDDVQALYCDEVLGAVEDLTHYVVQTFGLQDEELKLARQGLVDGWLSIFLKGLDELLSRGGGEYFADKQLTVADITVSVVVDWLCSGQLEHVPADIVQQLAPGLVEHHKRIAAEPRVAAYYVSLNA